MIVKWSSSALSELEEVYDYIDFRNPKSALRIKISIVDTGTQLGHFPEMGQAVDREGLRRQIIQGLPYILIYRVTDSAVEIISIVHAKRNRNLDLI